jgi:hypothetical protein
MNHRPVLPIISRVATGLRVAAGLPILLTAFASMHLADRSFQRTAP